MPIMNSNTAALNLQASGHHHHHQSASTTTTTASQPGASFTQQTNPFLPPATHQNHHRFNSTGGASNEGPWLLQSQVQQMPPTAPLRQHKRPAPQPGMSSSQTQLNQLSVAPKPIVLHPPQVPPHTTNVSCLKNIYLGSKR